MRVIPVIFLIFLSFNLGSHEDIQRVEIDCSTEVIDGATTDEDFKTIIVPQRRTNFAIPLNFIDKHMNLPEGTGFRSPKISVVAEGTGNYKFKDVVTITVYNDGNALRIAGSFGVPWKQVPESHKGINITDVKCYLIL